MNTKNDKGKSYTIIHSGQKDTHHMGVALIMNRESANTLMEWEPINERLFKSRFNSKYCKLTIIQCYAPTHDSEDDMKEEWYDQGMIRISVRQGMHGPNFIAPQHHRTKHGMERTTMHWLHRLQESF